MVRHFTLEQAQALLPEVRLHLETAVAARSALVEAQEDLQRERGGGREVGLREGGDGAVLRERVLRSAEALRDALGNIEELGIQVKDLDVGLLDFPSLYKGREVLLCWRMGEPGIGHWHDVEGGFRGRRRVDRDFLDHHAGDPLH